jgi:hypothetical protein
VGEARSSNNFKGRRKNMLLWPGVKRTCRMKSAKDWRAKMLVLGGSIL